MIRKIADEDPDESNDKEKNGMGILKFPWFYKLLKSEVTFFIILLAEFCIL